MLLCWFYVFFIFVCQAEDGIRGRDVTGVQTCALPISARLECRTTCSAELGECVFAGAERGASHEDCAGRRKSRIRCISKTIGNQKIRSESRKPFILCQTLSIQTL